MNRENIHIVFARVAYRTWARSLRYVLKSGRADHRNGTIKRLLANDAILLELLSRDFEDRV